MQATRADIRAALSQAPGGGSRLKLDAQNALIRAGCEAGADTRRIATGLKYRILAEPALDARAEYHDGLIAFLQDRDWSLNMAIGCAIALLTDNGLPFGPEDVYWLAGHLGVPTNPKMGSDLPEWFVTAYRAGRSQRSGALPAVAR
jgi:hypothetical protein